MVHGCMVYTCSPNNLVSSLVFLRSVNHYGYIRAIQFAEMAIVQELCESRGGRPNEPSGFRGRKELLNRASALVTTCP